jgi:hypothetical protein
MFIFWRMAVPRKWFSEVLHSASGLVQHWTTQYYVVTFRVNLTNTFRFRIDYLNLVVHDFQSWNLTTDDAQVEVCLWLRRLLTYKIPLYSVWCPHHHVLRFLRPGGFGEPTLTVINSTTCTMTYLPSIIWPQYCYHGTTDFGIKRPLTLRHAMTRLEVVLFT